MTKAEIAELIDREVSVSKKDIAFIIDAFLEKIKKSLSRGETIELRGFGTFGFKIRRSRPARNMHTHEKVFVPEHVITYLKPGKDLKTAVSKVTIDIIKQEIERKKRTS